MAHPQYVFTLPKLLRPIFSRQRAWLGELCRIPQGLPSVVAARLLTNAYAAAAPGAHPGLVLFVQTFGDLANFNPHLHVLAADGVFGADGRESGSRTRLPAPGPPRTVRASFDAHGSSLYKGIFRHPATQLLCDIAFTIHVRSHFT